MAVIGWSIKQHGAVLIWPLMGLVEVLAIRSTSTTSAMHAPDLITRGVTPRRIHLMCLALTALASLSLCELLADEAEEEEEAVHGPAVKGRLHFGSLRSSGHPGTDAPTRPGSLAFKLESESDLDSTHVLHSVMDKKLKRLDPLVQCNNNTMSLKVKRVSAMHFLVDNGEKPLTPLAQIPSKCGFTMTRSRRDVQFAASYQGCHVTHQGGEYILPLRLWGTPMTMSCPAILPSSSVICFPSGMVVKFSGISANDLTVKVSNTWKSLSSASNGCRLIVEVFPGGLTVTAPYKRDSCIEIKDDEYVLSLLWTDVELFVTCPSIPTIKPTIATVTLPSDTGQASLHSRHPLLPVFPEYRLPTPTHTSAPAPQTAAPTLAPLPLLQHLRVAAEKQPMSSPNPHAFPFMPQNPQYFSFPRPEPPTQSPVSKNTASSQSQLHQLLPPSQYLFSLFHQYPMIPGNLHPIATSPPPATSTEIPLTSPAATTERGGKHQVPQELQIPYRFPSFLKHQSSQDRSQTSEVTRPVILQAEQLQLPQTHHIPMLYSSHKNLVRQQNTHSASPNTTLATPQAPASSQSFYHPHSYMQVYYVPQQAAMPVFLDLPAAPPTNTAPSYEHKFVGQAMHLNSISSHQKQKPVEQAW